MSVEKIDTLVVGAGQAGIALCEHLGKQGVPFLVLEKSRIAEAWRTSRWDALVTNGPVWHDRFPNLKFKGNANAASSNAAVAYDWTQDLPILVRAMAKAGDTIYVIGPPDLVDEEESFVKLTEGDPKVQKILAQQETALQGKEGAILLAIDVKTGLTKVTRKLPSLPVWDSLAVANGKLFYTTQKGEVVCLGE